MALRSKTLEYSFFQQTASLDSGSLYSSETITIYVPETASRLFTNAFIDLYWHDSCSFTANRQSVISQSLYFQVGTGNYVTYSLANVLTDSGEQMAFLGAFDVSQAFNDFGSDISQSCNYKFRFTVTSAITQSYSINGLHAQLYVTYNYDDTNAYLRSKTVSIPLSFTGSQTNALRPMGEVIPILDTYCPEVSKSFDAIWMEYEGCATSINTVNYHLSMSFDNEAITQSYLACNINNSGVWNKTVLNRIFDTSTTHSFKLGSNSTNTLFTNNALTLKATYRYNHSASNTILNAYFVPLANSNCLYPQYSTDSSSFHWQTAKFNIQEPDPINMRNCAMRLYGCLSAAANYINYVNNKAYGYLWVAPASTVNCSGTAAQFRFDSGSLIQGFTASAVTINRGNNVIKLNTTSTQPQRLSPLNGFVLVNYTSGKHALGDGVHNHTLIENLMLSQSAQLNDATNFRYLSYPIIVPSVDDQYFYLNGYSHFMSYFLGNGASASPAMIIAGVQISGSDCGNNDTASSATYETFYSTAEGVIGNGESGMFFINHNFLPAFNRFTSSYCNKANILNNRNGKTSINKVTGKQYTTYHGITYDVSGSLSSYSGDGSGIIVECIESGSGINNEGKIFQAVTSAGGTYAGKVYDNTVQYFVTARQDSTHTGRSDDGYGS